MTVTTSESLATAPPTVVVMFDELHLPEKTYSLWGHLVAHHDEFTNPLKRRKMVEKRARKFETVAAAVAAPEIEGPADAGVTLVGFGSTHGVIKEAIAHLAEQGVKANQLSIKWIVPFHAEEVTATLSKAKRVIVVENNYTGQFAQYLRGETGITADAHIRKYDGEPFTPKHVVDGVLDVLAHETAVFVPTQEVMV